MTGWGRWRFVAVVGLAAFGIAVPLSSHLGSLSPSAAVTVTVQSSTEAQTAPMTTESSAAGVVPRPSSRMDEAAAWKLVDDARKAAGHDTRKQSEVLRESLVRLDPQEIVDFAQIRASLDRRAYTWEIWGAASVIEDGCSDDCFRDFRSYLISLGSGPYEAALRNPDSLATVAERAERGDWESADNLAADAYSTVTGEDFPLDDSDVSGPPSGTPWTEAELPERYPRLTARFR
jgi:hypothetical protein